MVAKMNRRTFLKTTAAAAVAVSMTGLLGGCGSTPSATEFSLHGYKVDIDMKKTSKSWGGPAGASESEGTGYLRTTIKLTASSGFGANTYKEIFSAQTSAGDALTLENQTQLVGWVKGVTIAPEVCFSTKEKKIYDALVAGETTLYLDVAPLGSSSGSAVRYVINLANGTVTGSVIQKD